MHRLAVCAQLIIAFSIALVWIVRFPNVVKEFHEYHLPDYVRTLVGATKIALATLLVTGIWYPKLVLVPALLMAFLMVCAQVAHARVHHPWHKYVPSLILLALSLFVGAVYGKLFQT
jgi:DoxX-like family